MHPLPLLVALAVSAAALPAAPPGARTYSVSADSLVTYVLVHKLHGVDGVSKAVEGRARLLPGGGVQVAVRARVDSFDSGNGNRDAHMREVTEASRVPYVAFKGAGAGVEVRSFPAVVAVPLQGVLDFHGRQVPVEVEATVRFESESSRGVGRPNAGKPASPQL